MPKLSKKSKAPAPGSNPEGGPRQSNPTLAIGLFLAVAVGLLMFVFTNNIQGTTEVMVAKVTVSPYTTLSEAQVVTQEVPRGSVRPEDLTKEEFDAKRKGGKAVVSRVEILQGQRVHDKAIAPTSVGTLFVTKPAASKEEDDGEVDVGVTTTYTGIAGGAIIPGAVVDVYAGEGGGAADTDEETTGAVAQRVKVLGIGFGPAAGESVRPGSGTAEDDKDQRSQQGNNNIIVILAVPRTVAASLAGGQVNLVLHPHETFDINGNICAASQRSKFGRCAASVDLAGTPQAPTAPSNPEGGSTTAPEGSSGEPGARSEETPTPGEGTGTDAQNNEVPPSPIDEANEGPTGTQDQER